VILAVLIPVHRLHFVIFASLDYTNLVLNLNPMIFEQWQKLKNDKQGLCNRVKQILQNASDELE
jgi:hypothetical protein